MVSRGQEPVRRRAVVFGAGAVGRGFVGPLFSAAGWHVTFVDVDEELVGRLNTEGGYRQVVVDNRGERPVVVAPINAALVSDGDRVIRALEEADFAATSVGASNLEGLAPVIAAGLEARRRNGATPLDFLLCENLHEAPAVVRGHLDAAHGADTSALAGLASTSIGRMIPGGTHDRSDPTRVAVEPYTMLPYDASALLGPEPAVPGLVPVRANFGAFADRKLYVHNMGHCMLAYLAQLRGLEYIWQAVEQVELRYLVRSAMVESAAAIARLHGMPMDELLDHVNDLLHRFGNRALGDTAERVGRDPERKMQPDDRLIGAHLLCRRAGVEPLHISLAVALGAGQLESEAGWSPDRIHHHLEEHLFGDDHDDPGLGRLLADQRQVLAGGLDVAACIARIDQHYEPSRVV